MEPAARSHIYRAYWALAAERQAIFHRRLRGERRPWTEDPVLNRYKFCNSYRASDRVSQYLIREVIHGPFGNDLDAESTFMRVVLFRLFSKEATWDAIEQQSGGLCLDTFNFERLASLLSQLREIQPIYTSAFILSAHDPYGHKEKHRNHLALVEHMIRDGLGRKLVATRSLKDVFELLINYPMIGPFLAYQLAIDLNYSSQLEFSEDDFTVPGPGAVRGMRKAFIDPGSLSPSEVIMRMVDMQEEEFSRYGIEFQDLFGRRLHAIDCQGLFCELDKYCREAFPELKSNRVRIKQGYSRPKELPELFYPPKWDLNERIDSIHRRSNEWGAALANTGSSMT